MELCWRAEEVLVVVQGRVESEALESTATQDCVGESRGCVESGISKAGESRMSM